MLRNLNELDFAQLIAIEQLTQNAPWSRETFERCWQAGYQGWVIEFDQNVVGFIIVTMHVGESHILNLGVHPNYQRKGFGRKLLSHAINMARGKEVVITYLEVRRSNKSAIALYQQLGFVQIGERKDYYPTQNGREDALVFAKDLQV